MEKIEGVFKVVQDVPYFSKGTISCDLVFPKEFDKLDFFLKYPKIFSQVYRTVDDVEVCLGDTVYRIVKKDWNWTLKTIQLTETHLDGSFSLYGDLEVAKKEIVRLEALVDKQSKIQYKKEIVDDIILLSDVDFEKVSLNDLKRKIESINRLAKQLKNSNNEQ